MALKTAKEYLESVKKLSPRVYCGGKWVKSLLTNKITRSMVMANAAIYELAEDPKYKEIMVATSTLRESQSTATLTLHATSTT